MKNFFKIIFLIFIFSLNSCSSKDDIAKIFFFDVNQGDSSFVTYNNISILIDTGEKIFTNDVIKILKSKNIKNIDYLILTHDHSDHSSGFFEIYDNFKIKNLILPDTLRDETFNEIENFLENSNITINYIKNPSNLKISNNFNIKFLSSFKNTPEEFNDSSLVFKLSINDFDVLYRHVVCVDQHGEPAVTCHNCSSSGGRSPLFHMGSFFQYTANGKEAQTQM